MGRQGASRTGITVSRGAKGTSLPVPDGVNGANTILLKQLRANKWSRSILGATQMTYHRLYPSSGSQ